MKLRIASTCLFSLGLACGGDEPTAPGGNGNPNPPSEQPGEPGEPPVGTKNDPALAQTLTGRYALRKAMATIQEVPVLGDTASINTTFGLVEIQFDGERAVMVESFCQAKSEADSEVVTTIPDAVPRAIPVLRTALSVFQEGDQVRFERPENATVVGAQLENPAQDALPTTAEDARVVDADGDGNPGLTVKVSGFIEGEIYLVQRLRDRYEGTFSGGQLTGRLTDTSEQNIIGASNPILTTPAVTRPDPDASKSTVTLLPLEAELDCDGLIAQLPQIFGS